MPPLSPTWTTSSFSEEAPLQVSHFRRYSSPHLEAYSPSPSASPSPSTRSRHGSLSEYHTPDVLPSPYLSPNPSHASRHASEQLRKSFTPYHSPRPQSPLSSPAHSEPYPPPQTPHLHASPLPSPEAFLVPPDLPEESTFQPPLPANPLGHVHAPSPVHGYRHPTRMPF